MLECLELREKDVDLAQREIRVRRGKGGRDRVTVLPEMVGAKLRTHLNRVRVRFERDVATGGGAVVMPDAVERKYPRASREWAWQYVFPATRVYRDSATGELRRHHLPARPPGRPDHDDLHPRLESGRTRRSKPGGLAGGLVVGPRMSRT